MVFEAQLEQKFICIENVFDDGARLAGVAVQYGDLAGNVFPSESLYIAFLKPLLPPPLQYCHPCPLFT